VCAKHNKVPILAEVHECSYLANETGIYCSVNDQTRLLDLIISFVLLSHLRAPATDLNLFCVCI